MKISELRKGTIVTLDSEGYPKKLAVLRTNTPKEAVTSFAGLVLVDILNHQHGANLKVIPYPLACNSFQEESSYSGGISGCNDRRCGMLTNQAAAYREKKGAVLGKEIVYSDTRYRDEPTVIFQVPELLGHGIKPRECADVALIARGMTSKDVKIGDKDQTLFEHTLARITLKNDLGKLVQALNRVIRAIKEFRIEILDPQERVTLVRTVSTSDIPLEFWANGGKLLMRRSTRDYAGFFIRSSDVGITGVAEDIGYLQSDRVALVAEFPEAELGKISELIPRLYPGSR